MPTMTEIRNVTKPVEVPLNDEVSITLHVFTRKGSIEDQRELSRRVNEAVAGLAKKQREAGQIDEERARLLGNVTEMSTQLEALRSKAEAIEDEPAGISAEDHEQLRQQIEELERRRDDALAKLEKPLSKLADRTVTLIEEGERAIEMALCEKLAFYTSSTNVTDDQGQPLPADVAFFSQFDSDLLAAFSEAVNEVLSDPLAKARKSTG